MELKAISDVLSLKSKIQNFLERFLKAFVSDL